MKRSPTLKHISRWSNNVGVTTLGTPPPLCSNIPHSNLQTSGVVSYFYALSVSSCLGDENHENKANEFVSRSPLQSMRSFKAIYRMR
jgi:hypothetical protein